MKHGRQGKGIGKAMLAELILRCEELNYRQIVAVIGDSANAGSIRLHASLGFVRAGNAALHRLQVRPLGGLAFNAAAARAGRRHQALARSQHHLAFHLARRHQLERVHCLFQRERLRDMGF